ncbi:hypothetical protein F2Q68_00021909 [Brassica cretica]|uniref:glycylpeptide N-tetradecanoyltransferase n=1 Tax=Brassica cretica TaxID=69181 RepID=A0A8S9G0G3_BRACR|nr:hypothetical protein F2Q68_00021909 [Brassica cretica]
MADNNPPPEENQIVESSSTSLETIVRRFQESMSDSKTHKFWETQPVGQFKDIGDTSLPEGPIEPATPLSEVKQEPYNLPSVYEWTTCDMASDDICSEVYNLLKNNYVEDDENMFRFNYSKEFLRWALRPPGYYQSWHIGVRAKTNKKLVAFISGVPARIRVRGEVVKMAEINFLCVHKKLRSKRLAPVMIKEVTRRVHLENIWQAAYTAGVVLPTPITTCQYWHRSLNPKKLIDVGFSRLGARMTMSRTIKLYKLPEAPVTPGVKASGGGAGSGIESCVAVREDFADEEDFVKAGGSEILYVQMQQNKDMDEHEQSKLVDKLPPISTGEGGGALDLVVIGCGPAGLALAAESAKLGLKVGLIGPDLPFTNNYGVWEDEFNDLGLQKCIEHVWRDTLVYLDDDNPITIGRAYGRVSRRLLHEELLRRCVESGVSYLSSKVESITEAPDGLRLVSCEQNTLVPCRLATVASGAASGKLLQYEVGGPRVCVQTAYGLEVEVEKSPYDPEQMVFMDYRDYTKEKIRSLEAEYPTFLYAMPMTKTRVFFEVPSLFFCFNHF